MTRRLVPLLVVAMLALLLVNAPSHLLARVVGKQHIIANGYAGTLWHGSADSVFVNAGHGYLQLGRVDWQLKPWSLLLLKPRLSVSSTWGQQRLSADVTLLGSGVTHFDQLDAKLPAALINDFTPFAVAGSVSAIFDHLYLEQGVPVAAEGTVVWQQAAWLSPAGVRTLGHYVLEVQQAASEVLTGTVLSLAGPLRATGNLHFDGSSYGVDVILSSDVGFEEQLQQSLALFAQPVESGYRIALTGKL